MQRTPTFTNPVDVWQRAWKYGEKEHEGGFWFLVTMNDGTTFRGPPWKDYAIDVPVEDKDYRLRVELNPAHIMSIIVED